MSGDGEPAARPRVVVVGPCASGKTTLVDRLRAVGVDARVSAQEHSIVRDLWARMQPDYLVFLDVDLKTLRSRRAPTWPESVYLAQQKRLAPARHAADVVIDTTAHDASEVFEAVLAKIRASLPQKRD